MPHSHEPVAGEALDQAFELEQAERGHDLAGGHAGAGDQIINGGRLIVQVAKERSFRVGECEFGGMTNGRLLGIGSYLENERTELLENVVDGLDQAGTITD
jgi:hypothetical protein